MQIKKAQFIESNSVYKKCPEPNRHEYAFIGRSNVGKSSLINYLTTHNHLAKISSKPGKTQLINHFLINDLWYLVDLPGYGYAKVSKVARQKFNTIIEGYIANRSNLITLFVLIDSRLPPQKIDLDFITWLGEIEIPFAIVFTKIDKLGNASLEKNILQFKKTLLENWEILPPIFQTSAEKKKGGEALLSYIAELNNQITLP